VRASEQFGVRSVNRISASMAAAFQYVHQRQYMVVKGHIENGSVALDEPLGLPNGTPVEIRPVGAAVEANGAALTRRFQELARQWKDATLVTSSITEMATHPACQQIIGMGKDAVPLILDELRREPDHWFWALHAITGDDPVPAAERGKLDAMTKAWLEWGERQGIGRP
jgi:hypothetical protein